MGVYPVIIMRVKDGFKKLTPELQNHVIQTAYFSNWMLHEESELVTVALVSIQTTWLGCQLHVKQDKNGICP